MPEVEKFGRRHVVVRDFLIPLLVGAVGLIGSLGAVYLVNENNTRQLETQKTIEFESRVLDQRLVLIDRAAKIFGKSPGLQDLWSRYLTSLPHSSRNGKHEPPLEVLEKLTEAQGEFQSVLFLAQAYFGQKTKAAITDLGSVKGPWWTKPKVKQDALIAAMVEEASLGLKTLPSSIRRTQ